LNRRYQRTATTITSGGNRNPANADFGGNQGRGRVDSFTGQGCLDLANAQCNSAVRLGKNDDKVATMSPHLYRQAASGTSGVAAIGVAQEFQRVWTATEGSTSNGTPRWSFHRADRRDPDHGRHVDMSGVGGCPQLSSSPGGGSNGFHTGR
jgi:hypothetical protein